MTNITREQRKRVEENIEFCCITNMEQPTYRGTHIINLNGCISLAFILGVRFGLAHPMMAGDYMARWIKDRGEFELDPQLVGQNHLRALEACIATLWEDADDDV